MAFDFDALVKDPIQQSSNRSNAQRDAGEQQCAENPRGDVENALDTPSMRNMGMQNPDNDNLRADVVLSEAGISTRIWDHPVSQSLQDALDNVLNDLHDNHKAPRIEGKGTPLNTCTKIIDDLTTSVSTHQQHLRQA